VKGLLETAAAVLLVVRRSLRQHALSTVVTVGSVALASGLVLAVVSLQAQTYEAFTAGPVGFDAVLGARGSQLQLVLNTVFHLETSPGNLSWETYETIRKDPRVALAIPYAVGDNYQGFRIVGTTADLFQAFEPRPGERLSFAGEGRAFAPSAREAVVGSYAAARTGLRVGSRFNPYHGVVFDEKQKHDDEYVVVGVLRPTNTPSDRVVWIPLEGVYRMSGHVLRGTGSAYTPRAGEEIPDASKEVSAVMLKLRTPQAGFALDQTINKQGRVATLAWPIGRVMAELFDKLGWANRVLTLIAYLTSLVASGSILASLYNTMNERRREFAILRALGARRATVFSAIVVEAATIALCGTLVGYAVYAAILLVARAVVRAQTGVVLDPLYLHPALWLGPLAMVALGALAGVLPALKAYSTDVATGLASS
jgi:putative ABC transport system permease protein